MKIRALAAPLFALAFASAFSTAAQAADTHYDVLEFTGPAAGKEADFESWYAKHIQAVLKVPGVKTVQRYKVEPPQRPGPYSPFYLKISLDTADLDGAAKKLTALMAEGKAVEDPAVTTTAYYLPQPKLMAKDVPGTTPAPKIAGKTDLITFDLLAMVNSDPEHEAEYNKNYDEKHFPDVIRNPGIQWGQRAKLVKKVPEDSAWPGWLAAYEYRAYDINAAIDEVGARLKDGRTRPLTFTKPGGHTWYTDAMGPELKAK